MNIAALFVVLAATGACWYLQNALAPLRREVTALQAETAGLRAMVAEKVYATGYATGYVDGCAGRIPQDGAVSRV